MYFNPNISKGGIQASVNPKEVNNIADLTTDAWCYEPGEKNTPFVRFNFSDTNKATQSIHIRNGTGLTETYKSTSRVRTFVLVVGSLPNLKTVEQVLQAEQETSAIRILKLEDKPELQSFKLSPIKYTHAGSILRIVPQLTLFVKNTYGRASQPVCLSEIFVNSTYPLRMGSESVLKKISGQGVRFRMVRGPHAPDLADDFKSNFVLRANIQGRGKMSENKSLLLSYRKRYSTYPPGPINVRDRIDIEESFTLKGKSFRIQGPRVFIEARAIRRANKENPRRRVPLNTEDNCMVTLEFSNKTFSISCKRIQLNPEYREGSLYWE